MYKNADDIAGHPLSGSGKLVPFQQGAFAPHAQRFLSTNKSNWLNTSPVAAANPNFYDIPGSIYVNVAEKYGLVNHTGSTPVELNLTV